MLINRQSITGGLFLTAPEPPEPLDRRRRDRIRRLGPASFVPLEEEDDAVEEEDGEAVHEMARPVRL